MTNPMIGGDIAVLMDVPWLDRKIHSNPAQRGKTDGFMQVSHETNMKPPWKHHELPCTICLSKGCTVVPHVSGCLWMLMDVYGRYICSIMVHKPTNNTKNHWPGVKSRVPYSWCPIYSWWMDDFLKYGDNGFEWGQNPSPGEKNGGLDELDDSDVASFCQSAGGVCGWTCDSDAWAMSCHEGCWGS